MSNIVLNEIIKKNNRISYKYNISKDLEGYFSPDEYFIEYPFNIEDIPDSILAIPFVSNLITFSWLFNVNLYVNELDKDFFECLPIIEKNFRIMHKDANLKGNLIVKNVITNNIELNNSASFFSGGIDATSTLISNVDSVSKLINIQGSDIDVYNEKVSTKVKNSLKKLANTFKKDIIFIKSSFRKIYKYNNIDKAVFNFLHDNYWHALQHGMSIICHGSIVAYYYKLSTLYIASSYSIDNPATSCASDPSIDNNITFFGTTIVHDGYDMNRGAKIDNIGNYIKKNNITLNLRVCFEENRETNCCCCEKCYRTIVEIESRGYDYKKFGFNISKEKLSKNLKFDLKNRIVFGNALSLWKKIQQNMINNNYNGELDWIKNFDFNDNGNKLKKVFFRIINGLKKRIYKLFFGKDINE